jgi:hypothetical protein
MIAKPGGTGRAAPFPVGEGGPETGAVPAHISFKQENK